MDNSLRVRLIAKPELVVSGTTRYTNGLSMGLTEAGVSVTITYPDPPPLPGSVLRALKRWGMDLQTFFAGCPLHASLEQADVYHIPTQTMATLLMFQRFPAPVVVTVLDIIPYLVRGDPVLDTSRHPVDRLFYRLALAGLQRADALVAISKYTKRTIVKALAFPEERVHVVYPALDHERFRPMDVPQSFKQKYRLNSDNRYILNVGSDDPRKNLSTLIEAFAFLRKQSDDLRLLKVGAPHHLQERRKLIEQVRNLGLEKEVRFIDHVEDDELVLFYNLANVFVMPSLLEGFGMPAAEAMACGTPVVCSNAASLPEVAGSAAVLVSPYNSVEIANMIFNILGNQHTMSQLREQGFVQSAFFSRHNVTDRLLEVYSKIVLN